MDDNEHPPQGLMPAVNRQPRLKGTSNVSKKVMSLQQGPPSSKYHGRSSRLGFLDLPAEMRNMIYEHLLVVGKVFYESNRVRTRGFGRSQLAILRTCKQIHEEAKSLYLSKNLFYLPGNFGNYHPFIAERRAGRHLFSRAAFTHVRNLAIQFKVNGAFKPDLPWTWTDYDGRHTGKFSQLTFAQRREVLAIQQHYVVSRDWVDLQNTLCRFKHGIDHVEADFSQAFYPFGFYRLHLEVSLETDGSRSNRTLAHLAPGKLHVRGLLAGEAEKMKFNSSKTFTMQELEQTYGFRILEECEETEWDAWKS